MPQRPSLGNQALDLDAPISWSCSAQGWNCCVGTLIPVRPFDMIGLSRATGRPASRLLEDDTVALEWDGAGILVGWLHQQPAAGGALACTFYQQFTADEVRSMREGDPERFLALPAPVRAAAESAAGGERIAGLCGVHEGRPEACRSFPFRRDPFWHDRPDRAAIRVSDCGTCALAEATTARAVMLDNGLIDYWRADEAYRAVAGYLHGLGLARTRAPGYRPAPVDADAQERLWRALFEADAHPSTSAHTLHDDARAFARTLESVLATAHALLDRAGVTSEHLGPPSAPPERPDLGALLNPARPVLPG
jgi:hypothetical protein